MEDRQWAAGNGQWVTERVIAYRLLPIALLLYLSRYQFKLVAELKHLPF